MKRPKGGALLVVLPRLSMAPDAAGFGVALTSGGRAVWDSGELPPPGGVDARDSLELRGENLTGCAGKTQIEDQDRRHGR